MNITVIGLGLLGGAFAEAFTRAGHNVRARDLNRAAIKRATDDGAVSGEADDGDISRSDVIVLAAYSDSVAPILRDLCERGIVTAGTVVFDVCGTKRAIMRECGALARAHNFHFIGGHPMAGREWSGYSPNLRLLDGTAMLLTVDADTDSIVLDGLTALLCSAGFRTVRVVSPEEHDRVIAYTSQLAHVVSSAYACSPIAAEYYHFTDELGDEFAPFAAGSYRDLTRVAGLNAAMWAPLFAENRDNLVPQIDLVIEHLRRYRDTIAGGDAASIRALIEQVGNNNKKL